MKSNKENYIKTKKKNHTVDYCIVNCVHYVLCIIELCIDIIRYSCL